MLRKEEVPSMILAETQGVTSHRSFDNRSLTGVKSLGATAVGNLARHKSSASWVVVVGVSI